MVGEPRAAGGMGPGFRRDDRGGDAKTLAAWNRLLACYRRADAAVDAMAGLDDDDRDDRLLGRLNAALKRLLTTPAPNPAALADKLDLLVRHQAWELSFAEPSLLAIRRDARAFSRSS